MASASTDTFHSLCVELLEALEGYVDYSPVLDEVVEDEKRLIERTRAALAQSEPVKTPKPIRPDCFEFAMDFLGDPEEAELRNYIESLEAALAQSEPRGPVSQELLDAWEECKSAEPDPSFPKPIVFARAILARFGHLTIKPVPIGEGLPKAKDCDARGWCWVLYGPYTTWTLEPPLDSNRQPCGWSHWLPATALPLPAGKEGQ